jgi:hypothetical protein
MKIDQQTAPPVLQRGKIGPQTGRAALHTCRPSCKCAMASRTPADRRGKPLRASVRPDKGGLQGAISRGNLSNATINISSPPATRQRLAATVNRRTATAARDVQQHAHRVHTEIRVLARRPETGTLKVALCLCVSVARHERRVESEDAEQEATQHRIRTRRSDVSLESYFVE